MKKIYLFFAFFVFAIFLSGCSSKNQAMNELADDGKYHYENKDLGFNIVLPSEFIYYQTQRKKVGDIMDLEFFVPTADTSYVQEVFGYAKPVVVRIFEKDDWSATDDNEKKIYEKIGEKNNSVFTIKFWEKIPEDWKNKWNDDIKREIIDGFELR